MKKRMLGSIYLMIAVLIWGSTFVAQSVGMDKIGPFTFQTSRCVLAILFLIPAIALFEAHDLGNYFRKWLQKDLWIAGIQCGLALFAAASLQQVSLVNTDAGRAGFLTALYVIFVPIIGLVLGKKLQLNVAISIGLSVVGLYLLSGAGLENMQSGDIMLLGSAFCFAIQITLIEKWGNQVDGLRLNCIQCLVTAVLSAIFMIFTETPQTQAVLDCWLPIGYAGVLSMGVAYSLQVLGQQRLDSTPATIIMSTESVIAAICGWLILHEIMSTKELLGCCLVFTAVILSQISFPKKRT
jgi:drug/metabolite transporter (DMT)-like permease